MSQILLAVHTNISNDIESMLDTMAYEKKVKSNGNCYFSFSYENWGDPEDIWVPSLMTYLFSVVGMNSYAFIRLGDEADDIEFHGNIENFNISIETTVNIHE
jgi:hypothetical protein